VSPDTDYAAAAAIAQRIVEPEPRRVLLKAAHRALQLERDSRTITECQRLLAHWRSMPEHITGGMAIQQLDGVLRGALAPGGGPRK
jgi:hypothetical protein